MWLQPADLVADGKIACTIYVSFSYSLSVTGRTNILDTRDCRSRAVPPDPPSGRRAVTGGGQGQVSVLRELPVFYSQDPQSSAMCPEKVRCISVIDLFLRMWFTTLFLRVSIKGNKSQKHVLRPECLEGPDDEDPVTALEWDPLSADYLLVANSHYGIRLIDSESLYCISTFSCPGAAASVHCLAWVPSAPGMFVTGGT